MSPKPENTKHGRCTATAKSTGEQCGRPAIGEHGVCGYHGGKTIDGGAPEGNTNASKHGAWSESFVTDFLTDKEIARVRQAEDLLGEPDTAQDVGRTAAAIALEQFRRTGDDRFLRRYESICDTFGIAPADEMDLSVDAEVDVSGDVTAEFVTYQNNE